MTAVDLSDAAISKLVKAAWDHREDSPTASAGTDAGRRAGDLLRYGDDHFAKLKAQGDSILTALAGISVTVSDTQLQALGTQVGAAIVADPALAENFAELVADKLAARLQN